MGITLTPEETRSLCMGIAEEIDRMTRGEVETVVVELARATVPGFIMTADAQLWAQLRAHYAGYKTGKALLNMTPAPPSAAQSPAGSAPLESLNRFPRLTRTIYLQLTGKQPPPFDPGRTIQRWADPAGIAGVYDNTAQTYTYSYWVIDPVTMTPRYLETVLPAKNARTPNLPGAFVYLPYDVPASGLYIALHDLEGNEIQRQYADKFMLSTAAQADTLKSQLAGIGPIDVVDATDFMQPPYNYIREATETRGLFQLNINGTPWNVGSLLKNQNAAGVGSPGKWVKNDATGGPQWISEIPPTVSEYDPRPETPCPQRKLGTNEEIFVPLFGSPFVRLKQADAPAAPSDQTPILEEIRQTVERIDENTRPR